jgi:ABC-type phosphate transport system auxiliary subunit
VVHASEISLLIILSVLFVTAQRAFFYFHPADVVSHSPRAVSTRGATHHALSTKNARSTRRERRIHPTLTLIV